MEIEIPQRWREGFRELREQHRKSGLRQLGGVIVRLNGRSQSGALAKLDQSPQEEEITDHFTQTAAPSTILGNTPLQTLERWLPRMLKPVMGFQCAGTLCSKRYDHGWEEAVVAYCPRRTEISEFHRIIQDLSERSLTLTRKLLATDPSVVTDMNWDQLEGSLASWGENQSLYSDSEIWTWFVTMNLALINQRDQDAASRSGCHSILVRASDAPLEGENVQLVDAKSNYRHHFTDPVDWYGASLDALNRLSRPFAEWSAPMRIKDIADILDTEDKRRTVEPQIIKMGGELLVNSRQEYQVRLDTMTAEDCAKFPLMPDTSK